MDKYGYRQAWMTDDQWCCAKMYARLVGGFHHVTGKIKPWGHGIEVNTWQNFATYDFDKLTRLVFAAHDSAVRVEIGASGPGRIKIIMHKRSRDGGITERHPTLQEAINMWQKELAEDAHKKAAEGA